MNGLKERYNKLLKDIDFDMLELQLRVPNIFQILKASSQEVKHSNFLAWLLTPSGSHGLGPAFLKRLLREVYSSEKFPDIDILDVEGLDMSKVEVLREFSRVDIVILFGDVVICIENKIYSKEHSDQLTRYREQIESRFRNSKKAFVYLTPEGIDPETEEGNYLSISYSFIAEALTHINTVYEERLNRHAHNYINDYIEIIKRELMKEHGSIELARRIYQNHKELLDFIFESKPDRIDEIRDIFKEIVVERGYSLGSENKSFVRFLTPRTEEFVYINQRLKSGWNRHESFLFEIQFIPFSKNPKIQFKTVISPSDESYNVKRLEEIVLSIPGSQRPYGKKWLVHFRKDNKFQFDKMEEMEQSELKLKFSEMFDKFESTIHSVEQAFYENSDELLYMKEVALQAEARHRMED